MTLQDVLSDAEKAKLALISEDEVTKAALRKVFLFGIYYNGIMEAGKDPEPTMNFALSLMGASRQLPNDQLGQVLRAQMEGISQVEAGFKQLDSFKPVIIDTTTKENKAR